MKGVTSERAVPAPARLPHGPRIRWVREIRGSGPGFVRTAVRPDEVSGALVATPRGDHILPSTAAVELVAQACSAGRCASEGDGREEAAGVIAKIRSFAAYHAGFDLSAAVAVAAWWEAGAAGPFVLRGEASQHGVVVAEVEMVVAPGPGGGGRGRPDEEGGRDGVDSGN